MAIGHPRKNDRSDEWDTIYFSTFLSKILFECFWNKKDLFFFHDSEFNIM